MYQGFCFPPARSVLNRLDVSLRVGTSSWAFLIPDGVIGIKCVFGRPSGRPRPLVWSMCGLCPAGRSEGDLSSVGKVMYRTDTGEKECMLQHVWEFGAIGIIECTQCLPAYHG